MQYSKIGSVKFKKSGNKIQTIWTIVNNLQIKNQFKSSKRIVDAIFKDKYNRNQTNSEQNSNNSSVLNHLHNKNQFKNPKDIKSLIFKH